MFQLNGGLAFAHEDTPSTFEGCLRRPAGEPRRGRRGRPPTLLTEVFCRLHRLATLTRAGRLPPEETEWRTELLVDQLALI